MSDNVENTVETTATKTMNIFEISEKIAQRPPFQMIEKVTELIPNVSATGIKNVSVNEPYFMGHFPGTPIMPGVLVVESCAQLCSLVIEKTPEDLDDKLYVLLKIDGFKFVKPAIPGDRLEITVTKTKGGGVLVGFDCVVKIDGKVTAKGALTFTTIPKDSLGK